MVDYVSKRKVFRKENKKNKTYVRICPHCDTEHRIIRNNNIRPWRNYLCKGCRKKSDTNRLKNLRLKYKTYWEKIILDSINKDEELSTLEISKRIGLDLGSTRMRLKELSKDGKVKINMSKKFTFKLT